MNRAKLKKVLTWIFVALYIALILGISWIGACGVIKLVTLCFGWTYTWGAATGVWLILLLVVPLLRPKVTVKK